MSQININVTPDFARNLRKLMKTRAIREKSEAIRLAVKEAVERLSGSKKEVDFSKWLGMAASFKRNKSPKFRTEDDLWSDS